MSQPAIPALAPQIWQVGALCRAVADALEARFNPVAVRGEVSGLTRAASGHCYFSLKDENGQLRCAMFRRAASLLDFAPREGELVEVRGRLDVYGPRGDLQLIVESMRRAGQGALFERFLQLKLKLEAEGLFAAQRKRALPPLPRGIGLVTSLGAAALHDVVTALRRRVPHIPVVLAPAAVQGQQAPVELVRALSGLYALSQAGGANPVDVILLVRGGGSIEDLWAFNDEQLARTIVQSPVPLVCGVGHETDFTIADFCADLRAPTPTAAAELAAQPRDVWLGALGLMAQRMGDSALRQVDTQSQRLDQAAARLGRPSGLVARQQIRLVRQAQRMQYGVRMALGQARARAQSADGSLRKGSQALIQGAVDRMERSRVRLELLDPRLVLQRGYAMLSDAGGKAIVQVAQTHAGQSVRATLADGEVDMTVLQRRPV